MMEDCKGNFKLNNKYNSLSDQNLVHYFENEGIQRHLWQTGQIDRVGRLIDLHKNKSKIRIIEKQFQNAEKKIAERIKEENEVRERVQVQRREELERGKRAERIQHIKEDREKHRKIVRSMKPEVAKYYSKEIMR